MINNHDKKQLNYENMDEEHRKLLSIIRKSTTESKSEPTDRLILRAQVPNSIDTGNPDLNWQNIQVTVKLFVSYTGQDSLENIKLTVKVAEPFTCNIQNKEIPFLEGGSGTPRTISLVFGVSSPSIPTGTEVSVVAAYQSKSGDPRIVSSSFALPLALCGRGIPPVKDGAYKITLDINQEPPSLLALFEDIPFQGGSTLPNVFSFLYHDGTQITIIVAKNTNRFRIQSATFASLSLLSSELARRLKLHFANAEDEFMIGFNDDFWEQLNIYSTVIDSHFDARKALKVDDLSTTKSGAMTINDRVYTMNWKFLPKNSERSKNVSSFDTKIVRSRF